MIAYLKGKIIKKNSKGIIIDTGNVGYFVSIFRNLLADMKEKTETEIFVYTNVKEDAIDLYGFKTEDELDFFTQLISVSGIGPRTAVEALNIQIDRLKSAILNEDSAFITQIPGIGSKTAKRLILELKDKVEISDITNLSRPHGKIEVNKEVIDALAKLGYQKSEILETLKDLPKEIALPEEIIKYFLKHA